MSDQPKVSVIIPVYNAEKYLRECLDSVVNQTLKDIEIICVDDGSTDTTPLIIQEYNEQDGRVLLFQQENQGAGASRNRGLREAKGQYVFFIDGDDLLADRETLETLSQAADLNAAKICGGSLLFLQASGQIEPAALEGISYSFPSSGWIVYRDRQEDYYYQRFLFDRMFLWENNLFFPLFLRYQDPPFLVRAMICAQKYYAVSSPVYIYRAGGAKRVVWTEQRVHDLIRGLTQELSLTREAGLDVLHQRIVKRLDYFLRVAIRPSRIENRSIRIALLEALCEEVDYSLLDLSRQTAIVGLERYIEQQKERDYVINPKVTVIVPVYEVEEYLQECLDSLVDQSLTEIEIICVNDGSTDHSREILEKYACLDGRVCVIDQENRGLSVARNTGIQRARGQYLIFVDSDDYLEKDALRFLYEEAEKQSLDVLLFDGCSFYDPPELASLYPGADYCTRRREYPNVFSGEELYTIMRQESTFRPMAWLQFIRTDYYRKAGLFFREGILHEDVLFSAYSILFAERVSHRARQLYHYRRRETSITGARASLKNIYGKFVSMTGLVALLEEDRFQEETRDSSIHYLKYLRDDIIKGFDTLTSGEANEMPGLDAIQRTAFAEVLGEEHSWALPEAATREDRECIAYLQKGYRYGIASKPVLPAEPTPEFVQKGRLREEKELSLIASVIIPVYNTGDYLRECLESVIGQTQKNIEIICVNDGSTDNSLEILEEYAAGDSRITVISQRNRGQSAARNAGVKVAIGRYLYFLDSDDAIQLNALEEACAYADRERLDILLFDADTLYESEKMKRKFPQYETYYHSKEPLEGVFSGEQLLSILVKNGDYRCSPCTQLIRREYFEKQGLRFEEGIVHEDNLSTFLTIVQAERATRIPKRFFFRRVRDDSTMTAAVGFRNLYGYLRCGIGMISYLKKNALSTEAEGSGYQLVRSMFRNVADVFGKLPPVEKRRLRQLTEEERMWMNISLLTARMPLPKTAPMGQMSAVPPNRSEEIAAYYQREIELIHASASYKIGRFITWPARKLRTFIRCIKEHGMGYTLKVYFGGMKKQ